MKHLSIIICAVVAVLLAGGAASAQQFIPPGGSRFNPPPPLPAPKIEAPVVPKMDAPLSYDYRPAPRPSFSDRVARCLDEGRGRWLAPGQACGLFAKLRQSVELSAAACAMSAMPR